MSRFSNFASMAPSPSNFRQSLDRERQENAVAAGTFARNAALPANDGASAFGSVEKSKAARAAYLARQNVRSGGVLRAQEQENEDRADAFETTKAQRGLVGAQTGYINTQSGDITAMRPSRIAALDAATGYQKGQTALVGEQTNQMRAFNQFYPQMLNQQMKGGDLDLDERRNGLEMMRRYGPQMYQNQVAMGQNQVQSGQLQNQMLPKLTEAQVGQMGAQTNLLNNQALTLMRPQAPDAGANLDLLDRRNKMAAERAKWAVANDPEWKGKSEGEAFNAFFNAQEQYMSKAGGGGQQRQVSEEDIQHTMKANRMTREQVMAQLRKKGMVQ